MESDILLTEKMHFTNLPGLSSWDAPAPFLPISLLMPGCELDFFLQIIAILAFHYQDIVLR